MLSVGEKLIYGSVAFLGAVALNWYIFRKLDQLFPQVSAPQTPSVS